MPPRRMTQATIERLIVKRVAAALAEDRANRENVGGPAGGAGGPAAALVSCKCTYASFMKCYLSTFSEVEGAVGMCRLFDRLESVFRISKYAERDNVKFATSTLQGHALTWWNSQISSLKIDKAYQISWTKLRKLMTTEFCPRDEIQRMEQELLFEDIKGDVTSSIPSNIHEAIRMTHSLMAQRL
ncbi:putative reverse transcriptase domain-containing protein [Tanacetum coccineum]